MNRAAGAQRSGGPQRRVVVAVAILLPAAAAAGSAALSYGLGAAVAVVAAVCAAAAGAGVVMGWGGDPVHWPARLGRERTSAGWHEIRLLAEHLDTGAADARARHHLTTRIRAALGAPAPVGSTTRRDFDQALAALREHDAQATAEQHR